MIDNLKNFSILVKKHLRSIISFVIVLQFIGILTSALVYNNHLNYLNSSMNSNIIEYDEIDREHLCKIAECKLVIIKDSNKIFFMNPTTKHLNKITDKTFNFENIFDNIYFDFNNLELALYNKLSNSYYVVKIEQLFNELITLFKYLTPLLVLLFVLPLGFSIKKEQAEALIASAGNEAMLTNKSMIMITENIHHELNTPLEVIDNKIEKIHRKINNFLLNGDNTQLHLEEDFRFIQTSSEQIYTILEKMKGFKHLRYSNGNKSIKNIIDGAFKIISISNTNFSNQVDDNLKLYSINSQNFKNADLLNIIINHIKNSLEANASKVIILVDKFEKSKLHIRIIDNGNGIPTKLAKRVFDANFSTKTKDNNTVRGNGMYLNKQILSMVGGTIRVVETSSLGTTIEITIPAKVRGENNGK